jgi:flagellar biosynthesis GTPase FlhF
MRIKRFAAKNVPQALAEVQVALGPNAVLLETRQIKDPERRRKGEWVEVVAAVDPQAVPRPRRPARTEHAKEVEPVNMTPVADEGSASSFETILDTVTNDSAAAPRDMTAALAALHEMVAALRAEVGELRDRNREPRPMPPHNELLAVTAGLVELAQRVDSLIATGVSAPVSPFGWPSLPPADVAPALLGELEQYGLDGIAARHWGDRLTGSFAERPLGQHETVAARLAGLLGRELRCAPGVDGGIHVVLGGSGSGKSSLVVKLALRERLLHGRSPRLITLDYARPEGAALLGRYTDVFGLSLHRVSDASGLTEITDRLGDSRACFIDAPTTLVDSGDRSAVAKLLATLPAAAVRHLLLPAATGLAEMRRQVAAHHGFGVHCLAFSKVDEAHHFGQVATIAVESGLPVSWLSNGRQIPEDLVDANRDLLCSLVARQRGAGAPISETHSCSVHAMACGDPAAVARAASEALYHLNPTHR